MTMNVRIADIIGVFHSARRINMAEVAQQTAVNTETTNLRRQGVHSEQPYVPDVAVYS